MGFILEIYLLNKLVCWTLESHLLDLADCILTVLFQFCLFNFLCKWMFDLEAEFDSDFIFLQEYFIGGVVCIHQEAYDAWLSLLVILAAIDGYYLDPLFQSGVVK